ncbi:hypothetical protein [Micropruina sonneratiae]|uniref:hypothetical protein n=1 Tax=Micropruina sonneratiae TaxID=2986940 RepID=UPI002226DFCF|nr:hypothetical protein [Micropruina sp. KQZ13P-5]MCW3157767.1 hypothetical protein [Micropruina sp. KQZ13P-5]
MARVLVTGMSGAGKSTLLAELGRRGHRCVDTDYDGWGCARGGGTSRGWLRCSTPTPNWW